MSSGRNQLSRDLLKSQLKIRDKNVWEGERETEISQGRRIDRHLAERSKIKRTLPSYSTRCLYNTARVHDNYAKTLSSTQHKLPNPVLVSCRAASTNFQAISGNLIESIAISLVYLKKPIVVS